MPPRSKLPLLTALPIALSVVGLTACGQTTEAADLGPPHVMGGADDLERGRYLVTIGGCNDCHTDGFLPTEGNIPEDQWLLGSPVGWRGPWGTTYPPNLRLSVQAMTEDEWVATLRDRTTLPPMPWMNVNQMHESDARAIYRYVTSLGAAGEMMPTALPPDVEPTTPYMVLDPVIPEGSD